MEAQFKVPGDGQSCPGDSRICEMPGPPSSQAIEHPGTVGSCPWAGSNPGLGLWDIGAAAVPTESVLHLKVVSLNLVLQLKGVMAGSTERFYRTSDSQQQRLHWKKAFSMALHGSPLWILMRRDSPWF